MRRPPHRTRRALPRGLGADRRAQRARTRRRRPARHRRPLASIDRYDTVLLGSPIWNVRAPLTMSTFTEGLDFRGKTVVPFTTHAMSGLGTTQHATTPPPAPARPSPKASPSAASRSTTPTPPSKHGCGVSGFSLHRPELHAHHQAAPREPRTVPRPASI
ncbi:flavodoxin [Nonomuraea cypriaca]|uniref:flavodoxin n=1 Tax=Nonomuraea cypriaca TaxID=1187855 RepID=UPI001A9C317C